MPTESTSRWRIADVLERTRLDEVLDELAGPAERSGPGRRWHCPAADHDDHRASVTMHTDRHGHERWRCWSGDHRGDAVDLVMLRVGGTRVEAVDWLASRAGMIPDRPLPPVPARPRPAPPATTMDPAVERYVRICHAVLAGPQGRAVRDWLAGRGLGDATIRANLIGCDPGRQLLRRRRGLPYGKVPAATFPALSPTGTVTFVQARYLDVDAAGRKYDNPSAALAPHPRIAFTAPPETPRWPLLVVCEGLPDALTAAQAGYRSVGLLGAQAPDETVAARVANYAELHRLQVVVMCDANEPGRAAGDRLGELLAAEHVDATLVEPPADLAGPAGHAVVDLNAWAQLDPDWPADLNLALDAAGPAPPATNHRDIEARQEIPSDEVGLGLDD
jgi:DNA primase